MISLLASVVILGVLSVIAVKSLDGLPNSATSRAPSPSSCPEPGIAVGEGTPPTTGATPISRAGWPHRSRAETPSPNKISIQPWPSWTRRHFQRAVAMASVTIASLAGQVRGAALHLRPVDDGFAVELRSCRWCRWRRDPCGALGLGYLLVRMALHQRHVLRGRRRVMRRAQRRPWRAPLPPVQPTALIAWQANSFPTHP